MSALVAKIQSVVAQTPIVVGGKKLSPQDAETKIWQLLSDERIGVLRDDPDTHTLMAFVGEQHFRLVFCDEGKMALPSARVLMAGILGEEKPADKPQDGGNMGAAIQAAFAANRPVGQLKTKELLDRYEADSPQEVWDELKKRANGQPCIVHNKDGSLNVDLTLAVIQDIRKGADFGNTYNDGKVAWRLYPVGMFPEETSLVCPLTGKILANGYCSDLKVSWADVSEACMVFIRVIKNENPREDFGRVAAKSLIQTAKNGIEALRGEYPEEALRYDELEKLGQLPSLRVNRNSLVAGRCAQQRLSDPFGQPKRM